VSDEYFLNDKRVKEAVYTVAGKAIGFAPEQQLHVVAFA
jgi:hypothetical protein